MYSRKAKVVIEKSTIRFYLLFLRARSEKPILFSPFSSRFTRLQYATHVSLEDRGYLVMIPTTVDFAQGDGEFLRRLQNVVDKEAMSSCKTENQCHSNKQGQYKYKRDACLVPHKNYCTLNPLGTNLCIIQSNLFVVRTKFNSPNTTMKFGSYVLTLPYDGCHGVSKELRVRA